MGDALGKGLWSAVILARLRKSVKDMRGNIYFIFPDMRYLYIFPKQVIVPQKMVDCSMFQAVQSGKMRNQNDDV